MRGKGQRVDDVIPFARFASALGVELGCRLYDNSCLQAEDSAHDKFCFLSSWKMRIGRG